MSPDDFSLDVLSRKRRAPQWSPRTKPSEDREMNVQHVTCFAELSPDDRERLNRIANIWNAIDLACDAGGATPEVLEKLRQEVSDCLCSKPPELLKAERLTAQVLMLISDSFSL
jgi:hypothetical protein